MTKSTLGTAFIILSQFPDFVLDMSSICSNVTTKLQIHHMAV